MNSFVDLWIAGTGLSFTGVFVLCMVSFLGSLIAGALGLGGGVLVLTTMANLLLPIHVVVRLGSNLSRAMMSWRQTLMRSSFSRPLGCPICRASRRAR